MTLLSIFSEA
jgi:hypothetical protein